VNRFPSVDAIGEKVKEAVDFKGGNISVRLVLKKLGFLWKKTKSDSYF